MAAGLPCSTDGFGETVAALLVCGLYDTGDMRIARRFSDDFQLQAGRLRVEIFLHTFYGALDQRQNVMPDEAVLLGSSDKLNEQRAISLLVNGLNGMTLQEDHARH